MTRIRPKEYKRVAAQAAKLDLGILVLQEKGSLTTFSLGTFVEIKTDKFRSCH